MPIGLTASGEMVFPLLCKEFLEQSRGMAVTRPAAVEKPAIVEEQSIAKGTDVAPEISKPAIKEPKAVLKQVDSEPRARTSKTDDCTRYRTYHAASKSYRGYDGRRHACK
jgi:hypothetical protein